MNKDEMINNIIKETKCFNCIHAPICFAQKGGVNLQLASGMGCYYYQAKLADDEIVIKKSEYKELKKYRTDWLNSEKMHLQAELEDTEFELGCSNRLFQKVCEEKKELEKRLEQAKQETAREIFYKLKETLIINNEENTEWFDYDFTLETINELANKYGVELE